MQKQWIALCLVLAIAGGCKKKESEQKTTDSKPQTEKNDTKDDKKGDSSLFDMDDEDEKDGKSGKDKKKALEGWEIVPQKSVGKILAKHSYAQLEETFGKENLKKDEFCIEGDCRPATIVSEEGKEMVKVVWEDKAQKKIEFIDIINPRIKLANGVHLRTTLKMLARKNEKPIKFSGFDWDFGGNIQSYNKGKLENTVGDYSIGLGIDEEGIKTVKLSDGDRNKISGDVALLSNAPIFDKVPVWVTRIHVFFNTTKEKKKEDTKPNTNRPNKPNRPK